QWIASRPGSESENSQVRDRGGSQIPIPRVSPPEGIRGKPATPVSLWYQLGSASEILPQAAGAPNESIRIIGATDTINGNLHPASRTRWMSHPTKLTNRSFAYAHDTHDDAGRRADPGRSRTLETSLVYGPFSGVRHGTTDQDRHPLPDPRV